MSKWIKKGDKVIVECGNEKGKTGSVLSRDGDKVLIQGINIRKKHVKRKTKVGSTGIVEMEMPIHISNVCVCDDEGKPISLKVREAKNGGKELYYVDKGKEVLYRSVRK
jgi:large subunit ribosomal protein L24